MWAERLPAADMASPLNVATLFFFFSSRVLFLTLRCSMPRSRPPRPGPVPIAVRCLFDVRWVDLALGRLLFSSLLSFSPFLARRSTGSSQRLPPRKTSARCTSGGCLGCRRAPSVYCLFCLFRKKSGWVRASSTTSFCARVPPRPG